MPYSNALTSENINVTFLQHIHYATVKNKENKTQNRQVFCNTLKICFFTIPLGDTSNS